MTDNEPPVETVDVPASIVPASITVTAPGITRHRVNLIACLIVLCGTLPVAINDPYLRSTLHPGVMSALTILAAAATIYRAYLDPSASQVTPKAMAPSDPA